MRNELKKLIADNEVKQAITRLLSVTNQCNNVVLLSARYNHNEVYYSLGQTSFDEYSIERAKIIVTLICEIGKLPDPNPNPNQHNQDIIILLLDIIRKIDKNKIKDGNEILNNIPELEFQNNSERQLEHILTLIEKLELQKSSVWGLFEIIAIAILSALALIGIITHVVEGG